jgi:hypothetical protein
MTTKQAPCNVQTAEQVEQYYRNVKPGDTAVIRCTQNNALEYQLTKVSETNPKRGRVYVEQDDAWGGSAYYAKNGKSCFHPTGQSNLVVPTPEVLQWIEENPRYTLDWNVEYNTIPPGQRDSNLWLEAKASVRRGDPQEAC